MQTKDVNRKSIKSIWIESDDHGPIIGGQKYFDDNSDVIVTFTDETKFIATFFTYDNILTLRNKNQTTGECLNGKYFWSSDMIIIDKIDKDGIIQVIDHLLEEMVFEHIFKRIE